MKTSSLVLSLCVLSALCENPLRAQQPAVISNIKVLSDKVEDVSSLEAIEKSIFKPAGGGMSDADKAKAMWETVVKFRHHDVPYPQEFLANSPAVMDAVKIFNVYGYCSGLAAQPAFLQLARHAGYPARHWSIWRFGEPEIFYGNAWHMYDPGMINYFPKPDGQIASVDEIIAAVTAWHKENPGYFDDAKKLQAYMRDPAKGIKAGPALLANCPTLSPSGNYPCSYFGWYSTMIIYDTAGAKKPAFLYEEPYSEGYRVNNQLRRGEKLTFNWANKGLHVGMLDNPDKKPETLTMTPGTKAMSYTTKYGDLANQRIGNGTLEYTPPLDSLKDVALTYDNLEVIYAPAKFADGSAVPGELRPKDAAKPATLILHMPCSYVYLTGTLKLVSPLFDTPEIKNASIAIAISDNNGLDWKEVQSFQSPIPRQADTEKPANALSIDLQKFIARRYNYRLKITINGNAPITFLKLTHDIQHSQRALPALDKGENTITFSAGPNEGTVSIEPAPEKYKDKQPTTKSFRVALNNMTENESGNFTPTAKDATVTYPIETPGPITCIRFGSMYRAGGDKNSAWLYQVSFDNGKTFATVHETKEHDRSNYSWVKFGGADKIPANTKSALVRFQANSANNMILFHPRIDADYHHPNSTGFAPITITYTWLENSDEVTDKHIVKSTTDSWKIPCAGKPTLKSLILERP